MQNQSNWLLVDAFTVDQASALWCGIDPASLRPLDIGTPSEVLAVKQMLTAAITTETLVADSSRNPKNIIGDFSSSVITRENLQEYAKLKKVYPAFLFDTLLPFTGAPTLLETLEKNRTSETATPSPTKKENRGGRPTEYDWDGFTLEVIRIANTPDGLPETQIELVRAMLDWFVETQGTEPAESSVKARISKIYNHLDKAKNQSG